MAGDGMCSRQVECCSEWVLGFGKQCIDTERACGLGERSLDEIRRWIIHFSKFAQHRRLSSPLDLSTEILKEFIFEANPLNSAAQGKTIVWCIRKFCAFLTLRQVLPENPAAHIPHPKPRPREKLPEYLKPDELSVLLDTALNQRSLQDITILSLLLTAGPRPQEIVTLSRDRIWLHEQCILIKVKGGWYKRTPISETMTLLLQQYLASTHSSSPSLFLNQWGKPIDKRWIERMVRDACKQAGIKRHITPRILRHTFATYAADRHGITITRALLGHTHRSHSTEVYMHLVPTKFKTLMNCHPYQTSLRRRMPW